MDQYEKLANATRNLEQEYTKYLVEKCGMKIHELKSTVNTQSVQDTEKLEREKKAAETRLATSEAKIKELEEQLKKKQVPAIDLNKILQEIKTSHEETLSLIKKILPSSKTSKDVSSVSSEYQNRIKALENELEDLREKNTLLLKNERLLKEQKDSNVLLKDSLENRDKVIQTQKQQIERLNEQLKRSKNVLDRDDIIKSTTMLDREEIENMPVTFNAKATEPSKKNNTGKKKVNVESIIREDNKGFFNDLSFSNSSPIVNKSIKKINQ